MARPKRTKFQMERDRRILAQWWAMGKLDIMSQTEIAKELQKTTNAEYILSQQQISYDKTLIEKRWKQEQVENVQVAKRRELRKLDGYEREYLSGWENSKGQKEKHNRKIKNDENGKSKEIQVQTEDLIGDPRFLNGLVRVSELRAKLRGFEAPQKHEHTGEDGGPIEITEVEVVKTRNE